jgi:hypothetical protein
MTPFGSQHDFNATEGVAGDRDPVLLHKTLLLQPRERCQLVIQVIRLQQTDPLCGAGSDASLLFGSIHLIPDKRTGGSAKTLASPKGSEQHPTVADEDGAECVECLLAQHSGCTPMVI